MKAIRSLNQLLPQEAPGHSTIPRTQTSAYSTTRFASIARGYSTLVRNLESVNRSNNRIPWCVVCHLANQLESPQQTRFSSSMNKIIEVDFLPRETDGAFSWLDSIGHSARRILIVDNDKNSTHLVKVLLEKTGRYLVFEENDSTKAHQTARNFRPDLIFIDVVLPTETEAKSRHKSMPTLSCNTRQSFFSQRSSPEPRRTLVSASTNTRFSPSRSTFKSQSRRSKCMCPRGRKASAKLAG